MKEKQLVELLDRHIDDYLNNIAFELEVSHDRLFENFGFPMFGKTSKHYHEQVYFQSYLESYTRQMINSILREIFDEIIADKITWPELEYKGIYRGYTNNECEREFGFEFINRNTKVGYRYSDFYSDEIEKLLAQENLEGITLVKFEGKDEIIGFEYEDNRAKVILLWDLFHEVFFESEEDEVDKMYDLFIGKVTNAVEQANYLISLTTLPGFTPSFRYKMRNEMVDSMKEEVGKLSHFFVNSDEFKMNEEKSKQLIGKYELPKIFLENKFENVFIGNSDFAKSYLTSEYLYRFFKDNPMFDYTPIVSGYLKSIEQLLHTICKSYFNAKNEQKDFSKYDLGRYITDLQREKIFKKDLVKAKSLIISCLNSYRAESRNNLFHIDYLDSWDRVEEKRVNRVEEKRSNTVEEIRANTIFLYVMLLGAVDPELLKDPTVLGIPDIKYNQLFFAVERHKNELFSFMLNGKKYSEMKKERRDRRLVFDKNGLIDNTILFKRFDYDQCEKVEISRYNMPSEIWIVDLLRKKNNKIWPVE